jgi:hypothetical protein
VRAYKRIWKGAGWIADVVARLKVIGWGIVVVSGLAFFVWALVLRRFGVVGTGVLVLGAVLLIAGISGVTAASRRQKPDAPASGEEPAIAVYVPDMPCQRYHDSAGGDCIFCHLAVEAVSGQTLRRCHGRLIRVEQAIAQDWILNSRFAAPIRLKWAFAGLDHPEVEYRDIRPGEPTLLDVVYTLERSPGRAFIQTLDAQPTGLPRDLGPGQYLLTVRVIADDRDAVDYTVSVGVPDTPWWHSVSMGSYVGPPVAAMSRLTRALSGQKRTECDRVALLREQYDKGTALRPKLIWPPGRTPADEADDAEQRQRARDAVCEWAKETWIVLRDHFQGYDVDFYGSDELVDQSMFVITCRRIIGRTTGGYLTYFEDRMNTLGNLLKQFDRGAS